MMQLFVLTGLYHISQIDSIIIVYIQHATLTEPLWSQHPPLIFSIDIISRKRVDY